MPCSAAVPHRLQRLVHLLEAHQGDSRPSSGCSGAEVGEPSVVGPNRSHRSFLLTIGDVEPDRAVTAREGIREDHLCDRALVLERSQPQIAVPVHRLVEARMRIEALVGARHRLDPAVEVVEHRWIHVLAIADA
jgi:hypothetical protein